MESGSKQNRRNEGDVEVKARREGKSKYEVTSKDGEGWATI